MQVDIRKRFEGKVVLVTGASGGLGESIAKMFASEGAILIVADIDEFRGQALATALQKGNCRASFVALDVSSPEAWASAAAVIRKEFGSLHVLVNNAGIISRTGVRSVSIEEWRKVLDVNLTGPMVGIQTVAPLMRDSGGGAIVNIGSTSGVIGHPGAAYSASKWGLRALTRSAALDLLEWGIRINTVHPSQVAGTQITADAGDAYRYASDSVMPEKRAVRPEEIAGAVLFLASDEASYINATDLVIDGGHTTIGLPRVRKILEEEFKNR